MLFNENNWVLINTITIFIELDEMWWIVAKKETNIKSKQDSVIQPVENNSDNDLSPLSIYKNKFVKIVYRESDDNIKAPKGVIIDVTPNYFILEFPSDRLKLSINHKDIISISELNYPGGSNNDR